MLISIARAHTWLIKCGVVFECSNGATAKDLTPFRTMPTPRPPPAAQPGDATRVAGRSTARHRPAPRAEDMAIPKVDPGRGRLCEAPRPTL